MRTLVIPVVGAAVLDYLTGMLAAARSGQLSSATGVSGIFKKLALFCALALGFFLDYALPVLAGQGLQLEVEVDLPFAAVLAAWIVLNESVSIIENLARCGVKIPAPLKKLLKHGKKLVEKEDG